jgi:hypothetical protein
MKNKSILITIVIFTCISCSAQHIIPVEDAYLKIGSEGGLMGNHSQVYVKDINNVLPKFIGTWKGTNNGINYELFIEKITTDDDVDFKEDELLLRYKVISNRGNLIVDTSNLPKESKYVMKNGYLAETGSYVFNYIGIDFACGQNGSFFVISRDGSVNKLTVYLQIRGEKFNCNTGETQQILPTEPIDLIKQ